MYYLVFADILVLLKFFPLDSAYVVSYLLTYTLLWNAILSPFLEHLPGI